MDVIIETFVITATKKSRKLLVHILERWNMHALLIKSTHFSKFRKIER